jgi:hypothetical protein
MTIYFLQPFPETRPLSSEEVHVFNEEGGGIFSLTDYIKIKKMHCIISERDWSSRFLLKEVR